MLEPGEALGVGFEDRQIVAARRQLEQGQLSAVVPVADLVECWPEFGHRPIEAGAGQALGADRRVEGVVDDV